MLQQGLDSFELCRDDSERLDHVLATAIPINDTVTRITELPPSDFYVVVYWQIFLGGKKGYSKSIDWMEKAAKKVENRKITFIKINADMQEDWGLIAGKKGKLNWRKKNHHVEMSLTNLPKSR